MSALLLGLLLDDCLQSLHVRVNRRIYVSGVDDGDNGCSPRNDGGQALGVQPPGTDPPGSDVCCATWHDYHVCPRPAAPPCPAGDLVQGDLLDICPGDEHGGVGEPKPGRGAERGACRVGAKQDLAADNRDYFAQRDEPAKRGEAHPVVERRLSLEDADGNQYEPKDNAISAKTRQPEPYFVAAGGRGHAIPPGSLATRGLRCQPARF